MKANRFDLNKYEKTFKYNATCGLDTSAVIEDTIFNSGGDMFPEILESFTTLEEAKDALDDCGNSITCNGNMVKVVAYAVECYEADENGEFISGSDYEVSYDAVDDRPEVIDILIENIVGEVDDYIEMAAAAYNAYKPDYSYTQEDLEDLAEEYMEAYTEDLRTGGWTADELKDFIYNYTVISKDRWERKVDDRYFKMEKEEDQICF